MFIFFSSFVLTLGACNQYVLVSEHPAVRDGDVLLRLTLHAAQSLHLLDHLLVLGDADAGGTATHAV